MRPFRRARGYTLIEQIVALTIMLVVGVAALELLRSNYDAQFMVMNQNTSSAAARQAADTLVDGLRGCAGLTAASASELTWMDNSGSTVRYWVSSGRLMSTTNGLPAGGKTVVTGIAGITFSYGTWDGTTWNYSSAPTQPSAVGAVDMTVNSSLRGLARQIAGSVRIRQKRATISGTTKTF